MPGADVEKGETLLGREKLLKRIGSSRYGEKQAGMTKPETPVGGTPGNPAFYNQLQLAVRVAVLAMLLGSMVWLPETAASIGLTRFAKHSALAICLMIFMCGFHVGGVINTASAGVTGCFMACLNIFILRGFFPDGVEPGTPTGFIPLPAIIGWVDLAFFNLYMLGGHFRMGFRITGMALNTGFMLCFLNPDDQTVFSKNFQINPNGAAVSAFIGTCLGSVAAVIAVLLPYPLGFATKAMKSNAKQASEDTCKLFNNAVEYFSGPCKTVMIDRQLAQAAILKDEIGGLGGMINDAYVEAFDTSTQGVIRALFEKHASTLGEIFELLSALQTAMQSEDFGPSHTECMDAIKEASQDVVDEASVLLCLATEYSEDGEIDSGEKEKLNRGQAAVKEAIAKLAEDFHKHRLKAGKPVCKDLLNEAFFVFCVSAFGRKVNEYAECLCDDGKCPAGASFCTEFITAVKSVFEPPDPYHFRIVSRYWWSLMVCFAFSVFIDGYNGACAVTAVFLINTRVGPDVMAMIQGLLAVVVGVVFNALMYSFSCKYANTQTLMGISFFYWILTILVAKGTSSLAGVGLFMAALAPFAIVTACPAAVTVEMENAKAVGLWGSIRALLIAVVLTVLLEIVHIPGQFTSMAIESLDESFEGLKQAFTDVFAEKDVGDALAIVAAKAADAETYNTAAKMEPRLWNCPWKGDFLLNTTAGLKKLRSDVLVIRLALLGDDGKVSKVFSHLNKVPQARDMQMDLNRTIEDARELCIEVLKHGEGKFNGLTHLDEVEGLAELEGFDEALDALDEHLEFPKEAPATMEADELVQLSIIFVMFEYLIAHIAEMIEGAVQLS